jgi:hypothetical protein
MAGRRVIKKNLSVGANYLTSPALDTTLERNYQIVLLPTISVCGAARNARLIDAYHALIFVNYYVTFLIYSVGVVG